jgi:hypothetical protein
MNKLAHSDFPKLPSLTIPSHNLASQGLLLVLHTAPPCAPSFYANDDAPPQKSGSNGTYITAVVYNMFNLNELVELI